MIKHGRVSITGVAALFLVSGALRLGVWVQNPDKEPGMFGDPLDLNPFCYVRTCRHSLR